jgi:hypothetical protein
LAEAERNLFAHLEQKGEKAFGRAVNSQGREEKMPLLAWIGSFLILGFAGRKFANKIGAALPMDVTVISGSIIAGLVFNAARRHATAESLESFGCRNRFGLRAVGLAFPHSQRIKWPCHEGPRRLSEV